MKKAAKKAAEIELKRKKREEKQRNAKKPKFMMNMLLNTVRALPMNAPSALVSMRMEHH